MTNNTKNLVTLLKLMRENKEGILFDLRERYGKKGEQSHLYKSLLNDVSMLNIVIMLIENKKAFNEYWEIYNED